MDGGRTYGSPYGIPPSGPMGQGVGMLLPDGRFAPRNPSSFDPSGALPSNGLGGLPPGGRVLLGAGAALAPAALDAGNGLPALGELAPEQVAAMGAVAAQLPMPAAQLASTGLPEHLAALTAGLPAAALPLSASATTAGPPPAALALAPAVAIGLVIARRLWTKLSRGCFRCSARRYL